MRRGLIPDGHDGWLLSKAGGRWVVQWISALCRIKCDRSLHHQRVEDGPASAGIAALKQLGDGTGELKSMRTHPRHPRKGVASALLEHIIGEARRRGLRRLSLETGRGPAFEPAL